jgi:hypothetical protein
MRPGRRIKRVNIVAAQCGNEIIAPTIFDWPTVGVWFEVWFEWYFCPCAKTGGIVVMDNARFHRKKQLERIAVFFGLRIVWLPPYSPDKNPIEHLWAKLKKWLRYYSQNYDTIQIAIMACFKS